MGLELDILSNKMEKLFNNILIQEKILGLGDLKDDIAEKRQMLDNFKINFSDRELGKIARNLLNELEQVKADFDSLYDNFDDKLMIFIIGNGNVGKSTLLNALIGYEIAETNFLPNTWKIDIYSPESDKTKAVIKFADGKQETLPIDKAKEVINNEEVKSKQGKKLYNENLNKALKEVKIKEEREEIKRYLADKYLYKSNISEVKWPVDQNWILKKCLLVDTPGLNQNLHDLEQLGNIHNYYHKADGVLWLLDGQTIAAANANTLFKELDDVLDTVGGVRDNIIGVINRMDMVRKNGGEEAAKKVISDAKKIFGNKFYKIADISAHQAFEGIKNNDADGIKESGILNLQNAIRDIFISKSQNIKNSAKTQGHNRLVKITVNLLKEFQLDIEKYKSMYLEKESRLDLSKEKLKNSINMELSSFFNTYLNSVSYRVDKNINGLADGKGSKYVEQTMYRLDELNVNIDNWITNKQLEIENSTLLWAKKCKISEYEFIENSVLLPQGNLVVNTELNLSSLNNITYYAPNVNEGLFTFLGDVIGQVMFLFKKNSIKNKINNLIQEICQEMKEDIVQKLYDSIDMHAQSCRDIIDITLKDILFSFKDLDILKDQIEELKIEMEEERKNIELKDLIL